MRSEKELKDKLQRLLDVQKSHSHEPKICPTCGHIESIMSSWILSDYTYLNAEIASLNWVLEKSEHLVENHT